MKRTGGKISNVLILTTLLFKNRIREREHTFPLPMMLSTIHGTCNEVSADGDVMVHIGWDDGDGAYMHWHTEDGG